MFANCRFCFHTPVKATSVTRSAEKHRRSSEVAAFVLPRRKPHNWAMSRFESPNQRAWLPCFPFRKSILSPLGTNLLWEARKGCLEGGRGPSQPPLPSNLWESEWCQPTSPNSFCQSRIPHRKGKGIQLGRRQRCRDKEWHSRLEYIPGGDVRTGS